MGNRSFVSLTSVLVMSACSSGASDTPDAGAVFIAYAQDFDGFHAWSFAPATTSNGEPDGLHGVGPMHVYWSRSPPHGATAFPVGTMVVKETEEADPTQRTVFAMVKRGGGYNSAGAIGWEWYGLAEAADGSVSVNWGLPVPPQSQDSYLDAGNVDCNACHEGAATNDYVWDSALQLARF